MDRKKRYKNFCEKYKDEQVTISLVISNHIASARMNISKIAEALEGNQENPVYEILDMLVDKSNENNMTENAVKPKKDVTKFNYLNKNKKDE